MLAQNAAPISGQWTIGRASEPDRVQLTLQRNTADSSMSNSTPVDFAQFRGVSPAQLNSTGRVAQFELVRDAGTFRLDGYLRSGGGGGTFQFSPNPKFVKGVRLGSRDP